MTLIAIDAGHGYTTPGKQSPDGMQEYAFNRAVAALLIEKLKKHNINTLTLHNDKRDVPLTERTAKANRSNATHYISIHANAFGNGEWNAANGIETFIHPNAAPASKQLAHAIHTQLITQTKRKDRGIKQANFHVLRETKMPAVLIECGFMTNKQEKQQLASPTYRATCAHAIYTGLLSIIEQPAKTGKKYRVQTGSFSTKAAAQRHTNELKKLGFESFITEH